MGLIYKAQLPYIDSLKKRLRLKANLQWIHFPLNKTPNTFYQTKELFKWSPAPKGIFLMEKSMHTHTCSTTSEQGAVSSYQNRETPGKLCSSHLMHGAFSYPHSWSCFARSCCTLNGISQCIPLRPLNRHNGPKAMAKQSSSTRNLDVKSQSQTYQCHTKTRIYSLSWVWSYNLILCAGKINFVTYLSIIILFFIFC